MKTLRNALKVLIAVLILIPAGAQASAKTLVVYYSGSGNTRAVAEKVAAATGADIFEVVADPAYSSADLNWRDRNSRVSVEHNDASRQTVTLETTTVPDWASYDTVLVGYPIWWGIAAWPMTTFVRANDFTGKTVIPFCTSTSSGLGRSGTLLEQAAGTGNWRTGTRFRERASDADVQRWVSGLGL